MAKPISSLESHPMRQRVIEALAANKPLRDIAAWTDPPVTPMALSRFKRHAMDRILSAVTSAKTAIANNDKGLGVIDDSAVTRAALAVAVDPFLQAAMRQTERRARWMKDIETSPDGPDYGTLAKLDRNDQTGLELHARLAGRLDSPGDKLTVQIVMPATQPAPGDDYDGITVDIKPAK